MNADPPHDQRPRQFTLRGLLWFTFGLALPSALLSFSEWPRDLTVIVFCSVAVLAAGAIHRRRRRRD